VLFFFDDQWFVIRNGENDCQIASKDAHFDA
jgi:hypothetical protein